MRPADGQPCTKDPDCTDPAATSCSGPALDAGGSGGPIRGTCCPLGTACDGVADPDAGYALGRCLANNGTASAAQSNDVCAGGVCVTDASACP
jgi:hypothetical protein